MDSGNLIQFNHKRSLLQAIDFALKLCIKIDMIIPKIVDIINSYYACLKNISINLYCGLMRYD